MEDALPVQSDARQFSEMCVCGSGLATLALPMQSDQAGKWCPLCPDLPRNAIPVTALCQCGKNHASLGLLEDASKGLKAAIWCPDCPDVPPHVINFKKRPCP